MILNCGPASWLNRSVLSQPVMVWIGLVSYPLYLWHWPLFVFANITDLALPDGVLRVVEPVAGLNQLPDLGSTGLTGGIASRVSHGHAGCCPGFCAGGR